MCTPLHELNWYQQVSVLSHKGTLIDQKAGSLDWNSSSINTPSHGDKDMWIRVAADLAVSKQSSGHTQQLSFPHGEILPVLRHLRVKRVGEVVHLKTRTGVIHMWENKCGLNCIIRKAVTYHFFDMRLLQGFPNLRVGELIPRIQVGPREEKKNTFNCIND